MFDNIGGKIKRLAVIICVLGILAAVIGGLILIEKEEFLWGVVTIVGGVILSWVSVFCLYGFGQLVENSDIIVQQNDAIIELLNDESEAAESDTEVPFVIT